MIYGRRISKPNPGVGIDWSHPLSQGLVGFFNFSEGSGLETRELLSCIPAIINPPGGWGYGTGGPGLALIDYGSYAQTGTLPKNWNLHYPYTIVLKCNIFAPPSLPAQTGYLENGSGYASGPYANNNTWFYSATSGNGNNLVSSSVAVDYGNDVTIGLSLDSKNQEFYYNGVERYSGVLSLADPIYSNPYCNFGAHSSIGPRSPEMLIYWWGLWSRTLSENDHTELAANPWQIFLPPAYRLFPSITIVQDTFTGSAFGSSNVSGASKTIVSSVGTASGSSNASGATKTIVSAIGSASGTSTASAYTRSSTIVFSDGTASGSSSAQANSKSIIIDATTGTASGSSNASANSKSIVSSVGTALGTSTASANSKSIINDATTGTAFGSSNVSGATKTIATSVGSAFGSSNASANSKSIVTSVGTANGSSTATGATSVPIATPNQAIILEGVLDYLATRGIIAAAVIRDDFIPNSFLSSEKFALVLSDGEIADINQTTGMGRQGSVSSMYVRINIFFRQALDLAYTQTISLPASRAYVDSIINDIQLFLPEDKNGNLLVEEPMRLLSCDEPRVYEKSPEWQWIATYWEIRYPRACTLDVSTISASDILSAISSQLVANNVCTADQISLTLYDDPSLIRMGDFQISIRPRGQRVEKQFVTGGGRLDTVTKEQIDIQIWSRAALDYAWTSAEQLTNDTFGLLTLAQSAFDSTQLLLPVSLEGTMIAIEPIRLVSQSKPRYHERLRDNHFGIVSLTFEVRHVVSQVTAKF